MSWALGQEVTLIGRDSEHERPEHPADFLCFPSWAQCSSPVPFPHVLCRAQLWSRFCLPCWAALLHACSALPQPPCLQSLLHHQFDKVLVSWRPACAIQGLALHTASFGPASGPLIRVPGMSSLPEDSLGQSSSGLPGPSPFWEAMATPHTQLLAISLL